MLSYSTAKLCIRHPQTTLGKAYLWGGLQWGFWGQAHSWCGLSSTLSSMDLLPSPPVLYFFQILSAPGPNSGIDYPPRLI